MPQRIRVATWNLYLGADLSLLLGETATGPLTTNRAEVQRQLDVTAFSARVSTIARILARERPDLVGLQELCTWHSGEDLLWDFEAELLTALEAAGEPYDLVVSQESFRGSGDVEVDGQAVTMRLEGCNAIVRRRDSQVRVTDTDTGMFGAALRVRLMGSVDTAIDRGWCATTCVVDGSETAIRFVNTHTEAYDAESRDSQRTELLGAIAGSGTPLVLVGDFNATPDEVGMGSDLEDAWVRAGNPSEGPEAATCCQAGDLSNHEPRLTERIDYIWVRDLPVESCVRVGTDPEDRTERGLWPSDHAALVATLVLG